jgi:hypothetical protein
MSPTPKPPAKGAVPAQQPEAAEVRNTFVTLFARSIDRLADMQKRAIDIAVEQNAELIDVYKTFGQKLPTAPRMPLLEVAGTIFERYADSQKNAIDLAVEQSHALRESTKDRVAVANKTVESAVNLTNQAVERSVSTQKKALETAAAQTKAAMEAARQQLGFTGQPADAAVNTFQRGVDSFVEAQKEMLDLVTH